MKILQVPFHYFPDAVGGTEVYVSALARRLRERGVSSEIAAPGQKADRYSHEGFPVHRFGVTQNPADVAMLYGQGDRAATAQFTAILERTQPDLVHLHAMSPAISADLVRETKRRGIPVVFTCHIPAVVCPRGTLLRYGREVCDGVWGVRKCTSCVLEAHGLPAMLAGVVSAVPTGLLRPARGFRGPAATALRMRELQIQRNQSVTEFLRQVDHIVAVSGWLRDTLIANGVPSAKISLCRQGSTQEAPPARRPLRINGDLRLAFVGRIDAIKGVHVLVDAIRKRPRLQAALDIFGVLQDSVNYAEDLRRRAGSDPRIRFLPPVSNDRLTDVLQDYDALAVPSLVVETGPLVVYDAFLAGIPVVGSDRGGIAELVTHERDGLLVEPGNVEAWSKALERLASEAGLRERVRAGVRAPRSMAAAAEETLQIYAALARTEKLAAGGTL